MLRRALNLSIVVLGLTVLTSTAVAGKGGNGGGGSTAPSSSIAIASLGGGTGTQSLAPTAPAYGMTVTWATTVGSVAGWETPEVVLSCYQDVNGDGKVDTSLSGPDNVYAWLAPPSTTFSFNGQGQTSPWSLRGGGPATCRADLDAYGWKSNQSSVRVLATTGDFPVAG